MRRILATWWPLAASWLLMALEVPLLAIVIARLEDPVIHLAAYGGVVFPLALIVEAPVIMLLAASTALSKDTASYNRIRQYMMGAGATLTALHILVAFTPLYYVVVEDILGAPPEIVEPARLGLMIMLPWTWCIAYRRFNQGVLIRFGHSPAVGLGTIIRLSVNITVLATCYLIGTIPGIVVGASAVAAGVMAEALYVGIVVRPVRETRLKAAPAVIPALSWKAFALFYFPLVMTSILTLLVNPLGSAALNRMPSAIPSLAVWSVVMGLTFMLRSLGVAYNEVVVALLDQPYSSPNLRQFAVWLAGLSTLALLLITITPLSSLWFERISALSPEIASLAKTGLWLTLPLPALSVAQSWLQGAILHGKRTTSITESVVVYLLTSILILIGGVVWGKVPGLYVGLCAFTSSMLTQTAWLWARSRWIVRNLAQRDSPQKTSLPAQTQA
jgi:hypothetical protein